MEKRREQRGKVETKGGREGLRGKWQALNGGGGG